MISEEQVRHVANLARLGLTDEEVARMGDQLGAILESIDRIGELDPGTTTVTYCNKGVSGNAGQNILIRLGFATVYNLSGGNSNYQTYRRSNRQTEPATQGP